MSALLANTPAVKSLCKVFVNLVPYCATSRVQLFSSLRCQKYSNSTAAQEESHQEHSAEDDAREKIFKAALSHVKEHGWSKKAIAEGANDVGYPGVAHGLFPNGGIDLINHFCISCNEKLKEEMIAQKEQQEKEDIQFKVTPFIRDNLEKRLRMNLPYIDRWSQALAIMSLPQNAPQSWQNLLELMDEIWYQAGDRSVDINWYTKRISLAAVYKSTQLHMIQDKSEDCQETWEFLDRRIDNLLSFSKSFRVIKENGEILTENAGSLFTLGRNILGMNDRRR